MVLSGGSMQSHVLSQLQPSTWAAFSNSGRAGLQHLQQQHEKGQHRHKAGQQLMLLQRLMV